jgi:glycosyltransferase involved in cell wall biosynthesis
MSHSTLPFVSVIMPIRNEADFIARSLGAVLAQDYPRKRFEVIVADGMSTDGTRDIVASIQARNPEVRLIDNTRRIAPTALNTAIGHAQGEILVRVDGHCQIAPDYVSRCVEHLLQDKVDGVGGPLETVGQTALARAIAAGMSSSFGVGGAAFRTVSNKTMLVDTVAFPAYTRTIVDEAGPFDEELVRNQDDEYNYRLRKLGAKILLAADVHSRYYSRSSLRSLWRQYFQYGYWKVRVLQKHPRQMKARQFVPPVFVACLLLALLSIPFTVAGFYLFGAVAGLYLLANLGASILAARKETWSLLPYLPVIYATLHLSFGLGFLVGLLRFSAR